MLASNVCPVQRLHACFRLEQPPAGWRSHHSWKAFSFYSGFAGVPPLITSSLRKPLQCCFETHWQMNSIIKIFVIKKAYFCLHSTLWSMICSFFIKILFGTVYFFLFSCHVAAYGRELNEALIAPVLRSHRSSRYTCRRAVLECLFLLNCPVERLSFWS